MDNVSVRVNSWWDFDVSLYTREHGEFCRWVAVLSMVVDHVGLMFFPGVLLLRVAGRLAFPLFAYGVAVGAHYTRDEWSYLKRMLLFAALTQVPYSAYFGDLNVLFSFAIGLCSILLHRRVGCVAAVALLAFSMIIPLSWGVWGGVFIWLTWACAHECFYLPVVVVGWLGFSLSRGEPHQMWALLAFILIGWHGLKVSRALPRMFYYYFFVGHWVGLLGLDLLLRGYDLR